MARNKQDLQVAFSLPPDGQLPLLSTFLKLSIRYSALRFGRAGRHSTSCSPRLHALLLRKPAPSHTAHAGIFPLQYPRSNRTLSGLLLPFTIRSSFISTRCCLNGGEGGIRTHGPVAETHAFQACRFVHSRTSPYPDIYKGGGILTRTLGGSKAKPAKLVGIFNLSTRIMGSTA